MIERVFILKRTEVFGDLDEDILTSLSQYLDEAHFDPGETIFRRGDVGKTMYIVAHGTVRIHDDGILRCAVTSEANCWQLSIRPNWRGPSSAPLFPK